MTILPKAFFIASLLWVVSDGDVLQIPYTGGKISQSVVITLNNGSSISPDSIRVGTAFIINPYLATNALTVCNNSHELGLLLYVPPGGSTRRATTVDTNWMGYPAYPDGGSLRDLDSLPRMGPVGLEAGVRRGRGYIFAHPGDNQCWTETYSFHAAYDQVVFVQSGGVSAKLKIVGFTHTLPGPPPPQYQPKILNTITLRMVVNTNSNDLVDPNPPVALRRTVTKRSGNLWQPLEIDFYSPLGIKLDRTNNRHSPALPNFRIDRPLRRATR